MLTLSIDTALSDCSVAIVRGDAILVAATERLDKGHAERLPPMAADALDRAGVAVADLDRVGVVVGPGGFAGVRVGLAFARGLALGTKLGVVGVGSLEALAAALPADGLRGAVADAHRGEVYAAVYDASLREILSPFVASPDEARARLLAAAGERRATLAGDAQLLGPLPLSFSVEGSSSIDPVVVARLAAKAPPPKAPPAPVYLRAPDARSGAPSRFAGLFGEGA